MVISLPIYLIMSLKSEAQENGESLAAVIRRKMEGYKERPSKPIYTGVVERYNPGRYGKAEESKMEILEEGDEGWKQPD